VREQALHHGRDVSVVQIGSNLDEDRRRAPETRPRSHHGLKQSIQPIWRLQIP